MTISEELTRAADRPVKPTTFAELKAHAKASTACRRCGAVGATHTISVTAAVLGQGRGSIVTQLPRVPVCEQCGVDVFSVIKRALKA
jgi:ribosomal protein L37E